MAFPGWKTIREAAEDTGYHPEYLRQLIRAGKIQAKRIGYMWFIQDKSLRRYIQHTQGDDARYGPHK